MSDFPFKRQVLEWASPGTEVPFTRAEYRTRLDRIRSAMSKAGVDLLYLSSPESLHYVCGLQAEWYQASGPIGWAPESGIAVHVEHDDFIHFEREHEKVLVRFSTISRDVRIPGEDEKWGLLSFIVRELKAEGWLDGTVGLEMFAYRPSRGDSERFQKALEAEGCEVIDATLIVQEARRIKSPQELSYTRTAARIGDIGMQAAAEVMRAGMMELEVYGEVIRAMARAGGENPAITVPVNSGAKSAASHGLASRKVIMLGEIVHIDLCGVYNRYHSNLSRSLFVGDPPGDLADMVAASARSYEVLDAVLEPGVLINDVMKEMRGYYEDCGLWPHQRWIGGYELGVALPPDWVGPSFWDINTDHGERCFDAGMVGNFESQFFMPRAGGASVLIDTMLFDDDCAELLHRVQRELIVVDN